MTEVEARSLLRANARYGGLESWIADRPWQPTVAGWTLPADTAGWCFRLMRIPGGLRISSVSPHGGTPEVWHILARQDGRWPVASGHLEG